MWRNQTLRSTPLMRPTDKMRGIGLGWNVPEHRAGQVFNPAIASSTIKKIFFMKILLRKFSAGMKKVTAILIVMEFANWYIEWHLAFKIIVSVLGVCMWLMFFSMESAQDDPDQQKHMFDHLNN